jgi:hypothetical protein
MDYPESGLRISARLRMVRHHLASRRHGEDDLAAIETGTTAK